MYFTSNIKLLRKRLRMTQEELAQAVQIPRPTLNNYENGVSQPTIKALITFSQYFHVSVDTLLKVDMTSLTPGVVSMIVNGDDIFMTGTKLRVLTTTMSPQNKDNIELVNEKAKAGYSTGFADPEFIRTLPVFQLPFLSKERKYRTFQVSGDSMLPIPDSSYVTGEFVENWYLIRDRHAYIIVTNEDGILFKIAENRLQHEGKLLLHSLNSFYEPFELSANNIREVWKFVNYISSEMPEPNILKDELTKTVLEVKQEIIELKNKLVKD